ncbi:MAG: hypothetical protein N3B21_15050 [Clostridia bacterium]|nr:hypothetical protein [Clostridia bacterium]
MEENTTILKEMSIGEVLDYSIEVYKKNFKKLTILALIFYVPFMMLSSFITGNILGDQLSSLKQLFSSIPYASPYASGFSEPIYDSPNYFLTIISYLMSFFMLVYSITGQLVFEAAIIRIIYCQVVRNNDEKLADAVKLGFKNLPTLIATKLLYGLIISAVYIGVFIVAMIPVVLGAAIFSPIISGGPFDGVLGVVVIIILIVALLVGVVLAIGYFAVKFLFGKYSVLIENKNVTDALSRSSVLTKGNFWHAALVAVFGYIVLYVFSNAVSTGAMAAAIIDKNLFILLYTLGQVIGAIFYPFTTTLLTVLFINLKIKKEGFDLEVKVDRLIEERQRLQNTTYGESFNV